MTRNLGAPSGSRSPLVRAARSADTIELLDKQDTIGTIFFVLSKLEKIAEDAGLGALSSLIGDTRAKAERDSLAARRDRPPPDTDA